MDQAQPQNIILLFFFLPPLLSPPDVVQKYTGFCRWMAAENVPEATAQLAEVAKIAGVATDNKTTRQWVSELYQALDEGAFRDQVLNKGVI